eukprot:s408_g16.t2
MCLDPWIPSILCPSTPEINLFLLHRAEVTGGEYERRFCRFQDGRLRIGVIAAEHILRLPVPKASGFSNPRHPRRYLGLPHPELPSVLSDLSLLATQSQVCAAMSAFKPLETKVFLHQQEAVSREVPAVSSCAVSKELLVRGCKAFRLTQHAAEGEH